MQPWLIWMSLGLVLMILELIVPGGIVVFLGFSAMIVSGAIYIGLIDSLTTALITWFITSIIFMFFLRSFFMKYFEGDSEVQQVEENAEMIGKEVHVIEEISPDSPGRVRMRDTTWNAKSKDTLEEGSIGVVESIEESILIITKK